MLPYYELVLRIVLVLLLLLRIVVRVFKFVKGFGERVVHLMLSLRSLGLLRVTLDSKPCPSLIRSTILINIFMTLPVTIVKKKTVIYIYINIINLDVHNTNTSTVPVK